MQSTFEPNALTRYFQFANERHLIHIKRQRGEEWPWTDDPILQQWKFTQVYRQLDAGTQWLTTNWIEPYADHPMLFFNICIYRQFNWIPTAEALGFQEAWDADRVYKQLKLYRDYRYPKPNPRQLYTNAHMVRGPTKDEGYKEKLRYTIYCVLDPVYLGLEQFTPQPGDNLQTAFNRLIKANGYGGFGAYEVVSDLRWTRYLGTATDILSWANAGPGATRGLNRLLGRPTKKAMTQTEALDLMRKLLKIAPQYLADYMPPWEMREVEHWACEWDKHERVRLGEGRPRMKFIPPHLRK